MKEYILRNSYRFLNRDTCIYYTIYENDLKKKEKMIVSIDDNLAKKYLFAIEKYFKEEKKRKRKMEKY